MYIKINKSFKARKVYNPVLSVDSKFTRLPADEYILLEHKNDAGQILLNPNTGDSYFVPNHIYKRIAK